MDNSNTNNQVNIDGKGSLTELEPEQRLYFRDQLREARAIALRDAEGFQGILFIIERLGYFLSRQRPEKESGLDSYRSCIIELARESPLFIHKEFWRLYEAVRTARNDAMHQGAYARHLTTRAVELAIILEDALMSNSEKVKEYMVRNPLCAELWQPISLIRQQMLANSFTFLPLYIRERPDVKESGWYLVSDYSIARFLRSSSDRKTRLRMTLGKAISEGLEIEPTTPVGEDLSIKDAVKDPVKDAGGRPLLIMLNLDDPSTLVGIVTPFDLL